MEKKLLPGGAFSQQLRDIEIHEIGMMKNDRFDRPLDLVSLVAVSGDHMHDFRGNAVLVGESDAAERMSKLLTELSLNHFSGRVFVILERLAHIRQERAGDEIIALDGNTAAKRFFQDVGDGDALACAGIQMLHEPHVDVAGEQGELDRTQFSKGPAFPAATGRDGLIPNGRDFFAQRFLFDLHQAGKKFGDFFNAVIGSFSWFHVLLEK